MFTGLVEAVGRVVKVENLGDQSRIGIAIPFVKEVKLGDSIAINGCCLTAAKVDQDVIYFDVLAQTLKVTGLGQLKEGKLVNLERALRAGDRLGGHFIQGHIDTIGTLISLSEYGQDYRLELSIPAEIEKYCIDKGSLAIDGISLTIAELTNDSAIFWIIPHTFQQTHLQSCVVGQKINLEADLLAKYTEKLLASRLDAKTI